MTAQEVSRPKRIELILRQIDSLPTLPVIATRLLSLTASDETHAREVIELVQADPALTAKVLSLCRAADKGLREDILTVDKAVVLLGFNTIRNAVLSIKVMEFFQKGKEKKQDVGGGKHVGQVAVHDESDASAVLCGDDTDGVVIAKVGGGVAVEQESREEAGFDHAGFWVHSLAVGVVAELIAKAAGNERSLSADEAFVCGLLHDVGKLALDYVLPKSYARVVELVEMNHGNIASYERRIVGIDHHTAGKRMAEQWGLPHRLQDCIWLHGSPYETLPELPHRRMVGLVSLADLLTRQQHLGYSGNYHFKQQVEVLMEKVGVKRQHVDWALDQLHDQLERRGKALGVHDQPSKDLLLQSIQKANQALGRVNYALENKGRVAQQQSQILEAVSRFHSRAMPGQGVQDVIDSVVMNAKELLGAGFYSVVRPSKDLNDGGTSWLVSRYRTDGQVVDSQCVDVPYGAPDLRELDLSEPVGMSMMGVLPWVQDFLIGSEDLRRVRLIPLRCGWGTVGVLLHDRSVLPKWGLMETLVSVWGSAIAAAEQHDGARRLGEELAESNSALAEAQDKLLQQESMARLGEMAAGAAHEMNNPLAVISGRSQLLSMTLASGSKEQKAAQRIYMESHRLSDLITALHLFADPPEPEFVEADMSLLLNSTVKKVQSHYGKWQSETPIFLKMKDGVPRVRMDVDQIQTAVSELLHNAVQSKPGDGVEIRVGVTNDGRWVEVKVKDDGEGMDDRTLGHAKDPFFSAKAAGRRVGMGLTRAQQFIEGHNGCLELASALGEGTVATLRLPLDCAA
ncbi:Sensor protein ZraS [Poriferisphaera corsica]|uniref:histidine kinase n=1 Tax=Poriferisphaera corsica TaxID=2528020 RepID=A0A517YYK9_9BACT|nr:HDOD domain-containing protein [Poriferisphaera corsica]QDU35310.1 Sensor protein ZraS [Poriferisphaera corsica]